MVRTSFIYPIVVAATQLGEGVLSARAAQKAFECRPVHKYTFVVTPLDGGDEGGALTKCTGSEDGDSGGRRVVSLPEFGHVLSVQGKSTLVRNRQALSLSYLRRVFLGIGRRAAWGEVRWMTVWHHTTPEKPAHYSR